MNEIREIETGVIGMTRIFRLTLSVLVASLAIGIAARRRFRAIVSLQVPAHDRAFRRGRLARHHRAPGGGGSCYCARTIGGGRKSRRRGRQHRRSIRDRPAGRRLHAAARHVRQHGVQQGSLSQPEVRHRGRSHSDLGRLYDLQHIDRFRVGPDQVGRGSRSPRRRKIPARCRSARLASVRRVT